MYTFFKVWSRERNKHSRQSYSFPEVLNLYCNTRGEKEVQRRYCKASTMEVRWKGLKWACDCKSWYICCFSNKSIKSHQQTFYFCVYSKGQERHWLNECLQWSVKFIWILIISNRKQLILHYFPIKGKLAELKIWLSNWTYFD